MAKAPIKKVAIGLPVFNGERYLAETLNCLLGQSYSDFDLIISDNASQDRTEEICRAYAARDPRIRYFRQPENLGAVPNFNRVFELSDSTYFKWAAVDDICDPTFLEKAVETLDRNPEAVWCHSRSSHIDHAGRALKEPGSQNVSYHEREQASAGGRFRAVLLDDRGCLDSYGLIRSEAIRRTPLFLPLYGPEKVFIAELALMGPYREIPETLFYVRVIPEGSGNVTSAAEQQAFADGGKSRRPPFTRLRFLFGYIAAIKRSSPDNRETLIALQALCRWIFQVSKWRGLLIKTLRGEGVGGGNVERLKQIDTQPERPPDGACQNRQ